MRFLKLVYYQVKQLYSKWFPIVYAVIAASVLLPYLAFHSTAGEAAQQPPMGRYIPLAVMALFTLVVTIGGTFAVAKQDVDFTFAAPIDPKQIFLARVIAQALIKIGFLLLVTLPLSSLEGPYDVALYLATLWSSGLLFSAAELSALLSGKVQRFLYIGVPIALIALLFIDPQITPLYGLFRPSPLRALEAVALATAYLAAAPYKRVEELSTNVYGVLTWTPQPRIIERPSALPHTLWGVIWHTSVGSTVNIRLKTPGSVTTVRQTRTNVFKSSLPIVAAVAAVYTFIVLHVSGTDEVEFTSIVGFLLLFNGFTSGFTTLMAERLWISLAADPIRYLRYRMAARTIIAAVLYAPWAAAFLIQSAVFPPSVFLDVALASAVLVLPSATWLLASVKPPPQIRELGVVQAPQRLSLWNLLQVLAASLYISFALFPYALAVVAYFLKLEFLWQIALIDAAVVLSLSAAFFYVVVLSERGAPLWSWAVSKLSENGYV
ncbi:hypothetical protein [Pyrobaculum neutrophilum]|uniref:ABC-2 type transport system permease protein n=1 Tax=Pyrobaculum neutrophilum (strain DSM 2338 / JCM 9278 / NBRC 100436 / V24Sta) TaxID=444157 RepID=B1YDU0_PYRNV|nr:hypothetical protein [Pyrobaculum neutrophilum]ACB39953.1 conserved hypothetical protein [Pyrobaculum neutrophilum V24Sta]